jgi:ribosomal protein L19E
MKGELLILIKKMRINFKKNKDIGIRGLRPYLYRENSSPRMNKEVYKKEYTLYTGDWFESGTRFAYLLHAAEESARKFRYMNCWVPSSGITRVYVSKKTLEAITKAREGVRGVRGVFISMEE